jgi:hypothetical protein
MGMMPAIEAEPVSYSLVRIQLSSTSEFLDLQSTGIALEGAARLRDGTVELVLSNAEVKKLRDQGLEISIVEADMSRFFRSRLSASAHNSFATGSMGGYLSYSEILATLQEYHSKYPDIVGSPIQIGLSVEGRPIMAVKVSDHPDLNEVDEPEVLYSSLGHAREPAGMMALIYFMDHLIKGYRNNLREVRYVVDHRQLWFIPVVNPDGYVYNEQTNPAGGGLWRKNRRKNADGSYGVDLNRNFGYAWGYDNNGSSSDPKAENYRGIAPFSEPEAAAIRDFVSLHKFCLSMNYHSYGGSILYPWSYRPDVAPYWAFMPLGEKIVAGTYYLLGNGWDVLHYLSNGDEDDWLFGERLQKPLIVAYTNEVGSNTDSFWPSHDRMLFIARENYQPALRLAWMAGSYTSIESHRQDEVAGNGNGLVERGEIGQITLWLESTGLTPSPRRSAVLKSKDPMVTFLTNSTSIPPMKRLGHSIVVAGQFRISPNAQTCKPYSVEVDFYSEDGLFLHKEETSVVARRQTLCP